MIRSSDRCAFAIAAHFGPKLLRLRIEQHDAAAVGLDPFENQLHDPPQKLIDIERMADGQGRAIHDLQIAASPGEPLSLRRVRAGHQVGREDAAPFFAADECRIRERSSPESMPPIFTCAPRLDDGGFAEPGEEHHRAADLHLVAAGKLLLLESADC